MIKEYVILGSVLVVMGIAQIWLRFGPWAKEQKAAEEAVAKRREAAQAAARDTDGEEEMQKGPGRKDYVLTDRGSKLWTKWTAILGPLGIAMGLALLIWGLVGE